MKRIVEKEELVPNIHRMEIEAPLIADKARAGQFVIVMPDEKGERVPFTISDWDAEKGTVTIFFLEVGVTTMKLAEKRAGEDLYALVGPLGKPATIEEFGTVLLGGGCYGIGGIWPIARALKRKGNRIITLIEGRSENLLYQRDELRSVSDIYLEGTSDNSLRGGKVQHIYDELRARGERIDAAYFIGCSFMMMNCSNVTRDDEIKTFVAMNSIMVDGTGMCGCCRVSVGGDTKFACVDGPEFDGHLVDWEELFYRKSAYVPDEIMAYQHHLCRALEGYEGVID